MSAAQPHKKAKLVGFDNFVRNNPMSDRFDAIAFHHVEFIVGDANNVAARFSAALGMPIVASSNQMTGNHGYASYAIGTGSVRFAFSAPYGAATAKAPPAGPWAPKMCPNPALTPEQMHTLHAKHGQTACAVGLHVADAAKAYENAVAGGAESMSAPRKAPDCDMTIAEVRQYQGSDVALRFISGRAVTDGSLAFLPGYEAAEPSSANFGIYRMDHIVGNVPNLLDAVDYMAAATGFHEFAEFTAEDVGTVDSGLNSMVMASNNEMVLFPMNEPTVGGKRKSQILTYLEQHAGPGVQHIALKTDDVFATVARMREAPGGFRLMDRPRELYYDNLHKKTGDSLTAGQIEQCRKLGILADKDDQGVLLQIFTKPVGDRSTFFFEIIQRVGCTTDPKTKAKIEQTPGCGGFGKGNFSELFRAIEEYETKAGINKL